MNIKILAIILIIIIIANMVLFAMKMINPAAFWSIIIIAAIIAYKLIPYLKNKEKKKA